MKLTHSVRYDAPLADVYAMLTDPIFREKAAWAQLVTSVDVTVEGGEVRLDMHQPNTDIPAFARKIAGESTHVIQSEVWNGADTAEFSISTLGLPASISGIRALEVDGDGTLDTFDGEAKARIPLIGGKIESLLGSKLKDGWDTEHAVGTAWLAGDR